MKPLYNLLWLSSDLFECVQKKKKKKKEEEEEEEEKKKEKEKHSFYVDLRPSCFYKNIEFPFQSEYSYFSADFKL